MIVGAFLILRISPMDFTQGIFQRLTSAPKSIRSEINESTHRKKKSFLRREIEDAQTILKATGKEARFPMICAVSLLLFAIGAGIAIVMGNFFLVPVMAVGMMYPFWYVKLTPDTSKRTCPPSWKRRSASLPQPISNRRLPDRCGGNIQLSQPAGLRRISELSHPCAKHRPRHGRRYSELRGSFDNEVFREWCDAVLACQYDRGLKTPLHHCGQALGLRIVCGELENLVFGPRKEFITMARWWC
jgi:hypothetical protein